MKAIIEENYENFKAIDEEIYSKNNIWKIYRYVNQYKKMEKENIYIKMNINMKENKKII